MNSTIHQGRVIHHRGQPLVHNFDYPVYFYCIDLAELAGLDREIRGFGYNRWRPVMIRDRDYLEPSAVPIEQKVRARWREAGCSAEIERIVLITTARFLGYAFNPVSFYLGLDRGGVLQCALAEVNNTFGDRHLYVLPELKHGEAAAAGEACSPKVFHVSPFNDMRGNYRFYFSVTSDAVDIRVDMEKDGELVFHSQLTGAGRPLTGSNLAGIIRRMPLSVFMTFPRIVMQAMKLKWGKGLTVYTRPEPEDPMTIIHRRPSRLERFAVWIVCRLLSRMERGRLCIRLPGGEAHVFGDPVSERAETIQVNRYDFFTRIMFNADVGLGEAFTSGAFDCDDPADLLRLLIDNRAALEDGSTTLTVLGKVRDAFGHALRLNTIGNSRKNIFEHYDLGNDFFQLFLDSSMTYSSARFQRDEESLHSAQLNKLRSLIWKAGIKPEHHVLEIGSGWGSFAIEAVMQTGCRVTTVTISEEQYRLATERVKGAGLQERITVKLCDYRRITGTYDRIVSIEMLEAVGHRYLASFFKQCDRLLAPDGLLALQVITIPEFRYDAYRRGCDWIQKHIFPGGHLPSLQAMSAAMQRGGTEFYVEHLENIALDYARTLRIWREQFVARRRDVEALGFDAEFVRKWIYYLAYCEAAFATRTLNTLQLVISRPSNDTLIPPARATATGTMGAEDAEPGLSADGSGNTSMRRGGERGHA